MIRTVTPEDEFHQVEIEAVERVLDRLEEIDLPAWGDEAFALCQYAGRSYEEGLILHSLLVEKILL